MPNETPSVKSRVKRRYTRGVLALVLALLALSQVYRVILRLETSQELDALRRLGCPLTAAELGASQPPLPPAQNGAISILEAADSLALFLDVFPPEQWPVGTEEMGPAERDEFREILAQNATGLQLLHAAAHLQQSRFPVDYTLGPATPLSHLAKIKGLARLLQAEAYLCAEEGQPDLACRSVLDGIWLARSLDHEPILISQWVRMACLAMSCSSLERVLNQHALSPAQLTALAEAFAGADLSLRSGFAEGLRGEICLGVYCFTAPPAEFLALLSLDGSKPPSRLVETVLSPYAWTGLKQRDYLFYLRSVRGMVEIATRGAPDSPAEFRVARARIQRVSHSSGLRFISGRLLPILRQTTERAAELEPQLHCCRVALGIELYRQQHRGALPERLAQLEPFVFPGTLTDPINGRPLCYRRFQDRSGYLVYSVGLDGIDHGGLRRTRAAEARAWTWSACWNTSARAAAMQPSDLIVAVER